MLAMLNLQTLMVCMVLVGVSLFICLVIYAKYQKTYYGYVHWLASFACSVTMLILFGLRGIIADFWSVVVANILGTAAMYLIYKGFCLFNGSLESWRRNIWPAIVASAAIIYYSLWQDDPLLRTLVMTACILSYSLLLVRACWVHRANGQRIACRLFTLLFFLFSLIGLLRSAIWLIFPGERGLYQLSAVNAAYLLSFVVMLIGLAFLLQLMNGLRVAQELENEKETTLSGQAQLIASQQQLRRAIQFAPFPLMVHAEDGEVLQFSEAWTEITGYGLSDIPTTREWVALTYSDRQAEVMQSIEALYSIETRVDEGESVINTRSGQQRVWHFSSAPLGRVDGKRLVISMAVDVTKSKQVEEQLKNLNHELEAKVLQRTAELEDLYNNAPCGYHSFDSDGVLVRINDTELSWLGLPREAVLGKRKFIEFVAPEYVSEVQQAMQRLKSRGFTKGVTFELRGTDGSCRQVVGGATAVCDANGAYLHSRSTLFDISEQHQLSLQNSQRDQMLKAFLDEASDPVHITDNKGNFIYVNQAWLSLLGYSRDETERLSLYDVTNPSEHVRWDWLLKTTKEANVSQRSEYVFVDKAGHSLFIETVILARFEKGGFAGTQAILIDVTARRKMEDVLREEQRKLSIANQELERISGLKDDFLASMSHELRTPLTAVIGLSEILRDGAYGELSVEQADAIASIEQSGRHLLSLINDILDLSKLESKQVALELEECSASDIGQASLQFVKSMAAKKGILVDFIVQPESIALRADPRRLKQMLINLLSNAVKFTPDGGKVGLLIRADKQLHKILFAVWDTGIGIRGEDMGKLFQPFVQIDSSLGRQYAGTGLGLVLVQKAARMHGGQVLVESTPGVGSRFTIELPWQPSEEAMIDQAAPGDHAASSSAADAENAETAVILLAEDNQENIKVVVGALREKTWRLIVAEDGLKAVELAALHKPDIILMDVQMPNMDGLAAMRLIRADADRKLAATPIIALTALAMKGDRDRCLRAGADEYIAKPIDFKELISKMEALLRAAKAT